MWPQSRSVSGSASLRAVLGQHELDEMLSERKKSSADVQSILDAQTDTWGIKVSDVEIGTVELTESMVRAISKQAEAERDRRAKGIHAPGHPITESDIAQNKSKGAGLR